MKTCKYCLKEFDTPNIGSHTRHCSLNPGKITIVYSEEHKRKISDSLIGKSTGKASTPEKELERRHKISERMKIVGGGYRKGSGIGKSGWYKNIWCDSSWELAFAIYHLDHDIFFERNKEKFEYTYLNKTHNYIPDFKIDDIYVEIKGRRNFKSLDDKNKSKIEQFDCKLKVLYHDDMQIYLNYCIEKYGSDFTKLYMES